MAYLKINLYTYLYIFLAIYLCTLIQLFAVIAYFIRVFDEFRLFLRKVRLAPFENIVK